MEKKPEILPFFPLSVLLFPGEDIPLRIFEPRYKQLIEDARTNGITFAIPFVIDQEIQEFGCEVRLKEVVAENPRGRMVITVESLFIVQIISYSKKLEGKLYAGGVIRRLPGSDPVQSQELQEMIKIYVDQFDSEFLSCCNQPGVTHQDIIRALNLNSEDKYRFVCMPDEEQKEGYLTGQLRYLRMIRNQETLLGNDFGLN
ncbi:MAG: LON peptidase substrate-binding domain-containing protein [Bacteroidales bacterium]|nr:LON peptidase substrate-binding domain-containing protein [Bacteroidales bacterium]